MTLTKSSSHMKSLIKGRGEKSWGGQCEVVVRVCVEVCGGESVNECLLPLKGDVTRSHPRFQCVENSIKHI